MSGVLGDKVRISGTALLFLVAASALSACDVQELRNHDIVRDRDYCHEHGMKAEALKDRNGIIMSLQCVPEESK